MDSLPFRGTSEMVTFTVVRNKFEKPKIYNIASHSVETWVLHRVNIFKVILISLAFNTTV